MSVCVCVGGGGVKCNKKGRSKKVKGGGGKITLKRCKTIFSQPLKKHIKAYEGLILSEE